MDSFNRQVCFNRLSFPDRDDNEDLFQIFSNYVKTIKVLKTKGLNGTGYGQGTASLVKENLRSVFDLRSNPNDRTLYVFTPVAARNPYIDSDTQIEERYINEDFEVKTDSIRCVGQGFIVVYLFGMVVISFRTHSKWEELSYVIRNTQGERKTGQVLDVVVLEPSETDAINLSIEQRTPLELEKCNILPQDKSCRLRDDHGSDKLILLWNWLRSCGFVISAISSLEFDPNGKGFVEKCFDDGKMHIRLIRSDAGCGMVIQTTEKNKREIMTIGGRIMQKYLQPM